LEIHKASTLDVNIVQVALVSAFASYHVLDSLAEELEDRLTAVPGVRTAERWGAPERQVEVALDLGRLAALRLPVAQVLGAIGGECLAPAGAAGGGFSDRARAGALDAAAARTAGRARGHDFDSPIPRSGRHLARVDRLHAQSAHHRGHGDRTRPARG